MIKFLILALALCLQLASSHTYGEVNYLLQTNALNYSENYEVDSEVYGHCLDGTPESTLKADAQTTRDDEKCQALGPCHIGFTQAGETVVYDFWHSDGDIAYTDYELFPVIFVNITLRMAAPSPRNVYLEILDDINEFGNSATKTVYGTGYHDWQDVTWENVRIEPYNYHRLIVRFSAGNTNLCSVTISSLVPVRPLPFKINALEYDDSSEVDKDVNGKCKAGQPPVYEPDAQTTQTDTACQDLGPCHVAYTRPGESMTYKFAHADGWIVETQSGVDKVFVDVTVRVASKSRKKFAIEVEDGGWTSASETFWAPGLGWQDFEDVIFRMVAIDPSQLEHTVTIHFVDGWTNMCSISVEYSKQTSEVTWGALETFNIPPLSLGAGDCEIDVDGMLAQPSSDSLCMTRDDSTCQVSLVGSAANYLEYHFHVRWDETFNIFVRLAAEENGSLRMELIPNGANSFDMVFPVYGSDLDQFKDVVWEFLYLEENEYSLRIYLEDDQSVCSVSVKDRSSRYLLHVPGTYPALFYYNAKKLSTKERYGDCPYTNNFGIGSRFGEGVDALAIEDGECGAAISEHETTCAVGWTDAGEQLEYRFKTDGVHDYINLSLRIASHSKNRRLQVEMFASQPYSFTVDGPGKGWDVYETVTFENLYIRNFMFFDVDIKFLDGKINLCSVGIEYVEK